MTLRSIVISVLALLLVSDAALAERPKTRRAMHPDMDSLAAMRYDIHDSSDAIVTLETDFGKMVLELYRDVAPAHADSFLARVEDGFYSGTKFHRIIQDFMIQGGNPFLVGKQNVAYYLPNELNQLPHEQGTLSMASRGAPTTAQTQFFICTKRNAKTEYLDGKYVAFGHLLKGYDVLWTIANQKVVRSSRSRGEESQPVEDIWLRKAYRSDAEGNPLTAPEE